MALNLTFACELYDRTAPLQTAVVKPDGIDINYLKMGVGEIFKRQGLYAEFDISEMSLSTYSIMISQGDFRLIAIPVFTSRVFRHSTVFVHDGSGIHTPKDMVGKRIGCIDYQPTALLWQRGFLQHDYGVMPEQMEWYFGAWKEPSKYQARIPVDLPSNLKTHTIPEWQCIDLMLESGGLDAIIGPAVPPSFYNASSNIRRLFPNYQEVEIDYYRRTGIFPIMHTVVIKRDIYKEHPWVAMSLYNAFVESKRYAMYELRRAPDSLFAGLPWLEKHLDDTNDIMGPDPFAYGMGTQNRITVETLEQYAFEQGLTRKQLNIEELFAPETCEATFN